MTQRFIDHRDGFDVMGLRNDHAELTVCPALGMRVIDFNDRGRGHGGGRRWLWSPPHPDPETPRLFKTRPGSDYAKGPLLGLDECLPGVLPCDICPDHGEVWSRKTELIEDVPETLRTRIVLPGCGLVFERGVTLIRGRARFDYRLTNPRKDPVPYLYAVQPLLHILPGDRIELPPGLTHVHVATQLGMRGLAENQPAAWPRLTPLADASLLRLSHRRPAWVKAYASGFTEGTAALVNDHTGDRLTIHFDVQQLPALGIWISRGGWNGYHQISLGPTNAPVDTRTQAAELPGEATHLAPGETRVWWWSMQTG